MREFVITTESNTDLPSKFLEINHIEVIPHYYFVEEEEYGGDKQLSIHEFYNEMRRGKRVRTGSGKPSVINQIFQGILKEGKNILHISFSSELSNNFRIVSTEARILQKEYPHAKIEVFDSKNASLGAGLLLMRAVELQQEGRSLGEIAEALKDMRRQVYAVFTVENLKYLYREGARFSLSQFLASARDIKPLMAINPMGKLQSVGKIKGRKQALISMLDYMEESMGDKKNCQFMVGIVHGDCEEEAEYFSTLLKARFGYEHVLISPLGPGIGAYTGPRTMGVIYMGKEKGVE